MTPCNKHIHIEHILEKGSGRLNEDAIVLEDNLFGVFDGASSLDNCCYDNQMTGGKLASSIASKVFSTNHFPLFELGKQANAAILTQMTAKNVDLTRRQGLWSTSAAVVRLHDQTLEWMQTGDSYIAIIYEDDRFFLPVEQDDHDYDTLCMLKNNPCQNSQDFRNQLIQTRTQMNKTYGVLNGEPDAINFINHGHLSLDKVKTILLFTDGLQLASPIPEKRKSFDSFVRLFQQLGLEGLKAHIRKIEANDPNLNQFPRFKCHDDIAAIAIHF